MHPAPNETANRAKQAQQLVTFSGAGFVPSHWELVNDTVWTVVGYSVLCNGSFTLSFNGETTVPISVFDSNETVAVRL